MLYNAQCTPNSILFVEKFHQANGNKVNSNIKTLKANVSVDLCRYKFLESKLF